MKKIIHVKQEETIAHLIDKIENYDGEDVYINLDVNLDILSDEANIKLLKREAGVLGKNIIIVSENQDVLDYAKDAGFKVELQQDNEDDLPSFLKEKDSKKKVVGDIKKPSFLDSPSEYEKINTSFDEDEDSQEEFFDPEKDEQARNFFEKSIKQKHSSFDFSILKKDKTKRDNTLNFKSYFNKFFSNKKTIGIFLGVLVVILLFFFVALRPKATVVVFPKKETIDFSLNVVSDINASEINFQNGVIPGQVITFPKEISGKFKATGESSGATKAKGKITIYNEFGKDPQVLIAKTRFEDPSGKIFRITKRIVVPGAKVQNGKVIEPGKLEVEVVADKPGAEYNIGPSTFTIPGFKGTERFDGFYAKSEAPMQGGSLGETRAITKDDIQQAKQSLLDQLKANQNNFILENVPNNLKVLDEAVNIKTKEFITPEEGTAVDEFDAVLKVEYNVFAFDEKDVKKLAEKRLSEQINEDQKTYPNTLVLEYDEGIFNLEKSTFTFLVNASEVVAGKVDVESLKNNLSGKNKEEIKKVLKGNSSIEEAEVTLFPVWSSKAPANTKYIKIEVKE